MPRRPIDAANWVKNWKAGMDNAQTAYVRGVQQCSVNPMEEAVKKQDKMKANLIKAIDDGRYAAGCQSVSKSQWQQQTATVGGGRLSSGATAALPKVTAKVQAMVPGMDQLLNTIYAMPNNTPAEREQRQLAWSRGMRALAGR